MGRNPSCSEEGLHRGHWSAREDTLLTTYIEANGEGQWRSLPKKAGLLRCGKSCRLRWLNYLRPGIKRGNITPDEDDLIIRLHSLLGNRWSLIAGRLPGRTDNEIKNHWHTHLSKRLKNTKTEQNLHKQLQKRVPEPKKRNKMNGIADGDVTVSKIYHPKPNRPVNNSSFNNQASCSMSYGEADADDGNVKICDEGPNLISGCDLSIQCSLLKNDNTLQKLYDEFLQLL